VLTIRLDALAAGAAQLRLTGHLDDTGARDLLHAAADVVRCGCSRLVVDLRGVTSWDSEAAFAVVGCTRLARWLENGVDVVCADGPARELAAHAGVVPGASGAAQPLTACPAPVATPDTMDACHAC
jgi:hypothetical protein